MRPTAVYTPNSATSCTVFGNQRSDCGYIDLCSEARSLQRLFPSLKRKRVIHNQHYCRVLDMSWQATDWWSERTRWSAFLPFFVALATFSFTVHSPTSSLECQNFHVFCAAKDVEWLHFAVRSCSSKSFYLRYCIRLNFSREWQVMYINCCFWVVLHMPGTPQRFRNQVRMLARTRKIGITNHVSPAVSKLYSC